jgi:hypothetical protein
LLTVVTTCEPCRPSLYDRPLLSVLAFREESMSEVFRLRR